MSEPCPTHERWQEHLDGTLPADVQASLTNHLDHCAACQKTLEILAGGSDSLLAVARQAGDQTAESTPALEQVLGQWQASTSPETQAESAGEYANWLTFLAPATKPGHLGRLGHYDILEVIGVGGFGIVLKAFDEKLHRLVAIKMLSPAFAANGSARKRFIREARTAAAVKNEHVIGIYDVEGEAHPPYLAMEIIDGMSLQDKIDKHGPLGLKEILRIGMQMAEGLAAAHKQGLVHRDIKPANILLENGVERVKITDFGLARAVDDASVTQSGTVAGTPMYMSPEQAEGLAIDHRSDLFSLGTVLYTMCTGHSPFRASGTHAVLKRVIDAAPRPIREFNNEIPDWLCDIIAKLHAKKPENRFQTATEVAELLGERLADVQAGRAVSASDRSEPAKTPVADAPGPSKRWRPWQVILPVAAGVFVVVAVLILRGWKPAVNQVPPIVKDGWVQLFNGKNLTGWKTHPDQPGDWKVEDGLLVGRSLKPSHLFSERGDYENFQLRAEAKISKGGDSGLIFRCEYGLNKEDNKPAPLGYEANIAFLTEFKTGSLWGAVWPPVGPKESLIEPDTWFTLEVTARENHIVISVNGRTTVDFLDARDKYRRGHLALQAWATATEVCFRKIEIKELPPTPPTERGWVQLFNGKDLSGWIAPQPGQGNWQVDKLGHLIGRGDPRSYLFTQRDDYSDFHLRAELKVGGGSAGGICFRCGLNRLPLQLAPGYKASLSSDPPPGSLLMTMPEEKAGKFIATASKNEFKPSTWFNLEVLARGNRLTVKINGDTVVDHIDEKSAYQRGRIALETYAPGTEITFKKVEIKELPPEEPGWIQLFNGKDLTGWESAKGGTAAWKVIDDSITCSGPADHLYTTRADYGDFHLRAEAKINAEGNSGIYFRTAKPLMFIGDYEAQITNNQNQNQKTGSLYGLVAVGQAPVPPDTWFTYDIIAQGNRIRLLVNGKETANYLEKRPGRRAKGHIALQHHDAITKVHFRKIEIKELPAGTSPAKAPPGEQWVRLFDGFSTTGWNLHKTNVKIKDGALILDTPGTIETERVLSSDFRLRMEVKLKRESGAIQFRSPGPLLGWFVNLQQSDASNGKMDGYLSTQLAAKPIRRTPTVKDLARLDEWFRLEIIAKGQSAQVLVDGKQVMELKNEDYVPKQSPIALRALVAGTEVAIRNIEIKEQPEPEAAFQPLFNGKDLSGWKALAVQPFGPSHWKVEDGQLVGRNSSGVWLFSEAGPYEDFHLLAEMKLTGTGDCGLYFRTQGISSLPPPSYGVDLSARKDVPIGSLYKDSTKVQGAAKHTLVPDQWFTLEVIARGPKIQVLVNGKTVTEYSDPKFERRKGRIALQQAHSARFFPGDNIVVRFRKIEIKELPPAEPGWVPLFNGKDLDGWIGQPTIWSWKNGTLVGDTDKVAQPSRLNLVSTMAFKDFEIKFQARLSNPGGEAGLSVRGKAGVLLGKDLGKFYIENGSNKSGKNQAALAKMRKDDFHDISIKCVGKHVTVVINGVTAIDEDFADIPDVGRLTFHVSGGGVLGRNTVTLRDIQIKELSVNPTWTPLFDGKDLGGWLETKGKWKVEDGSLVNVGDDARIMTTRLFRDFHCRLEMKVIAGSQASLLFRSKLDTMGMVHVQTKNEPSGSLGLFGKPNTRLLHAWTHKDLAPANTWATYELIARGQQVTVRVNGTEVVKKTITELPLSGAIGLSAGEPGSILHVRRVEIKELPTEK